MSINERETNAAKIEDYYVPKDMALARTAYLDVHDARNRNLLLSVPFGIGASIWSKTSRYFGGKPGAFLIGSFVSFAIIDFVNDLRFNQVT
jgi:hypothetical protein